MRDLKDPNGAQVRFLRKVPRDPMHPDPDIVPEQSWGLRSYASDHTSPHPGRDIFDVYSLAEGKGINGVPYKDW